MKNILIIKGNHDLADLLIHQLHAADHQVTALSRNLEEPTLPETVYHLHADRTDNQQMKLALLGKRFDTVVDFALPSAESAQQIVDLLDGQIAQYIFISTGQVYLVQEGIERPFKETDYNEGRLQAEPKEHTFAHEEWKYGVEKRQIEDTFRRAWDERQFPCVSLRLPMVNSERDQFLRLYSYVIRLKDGGPILIPETPTYPLRHVYGGDVVDAIHHLVENPTETGRAYNLSQDESVSIDEFLDLLGSILGVSVQKVRAKRSVLDANGFLPYCSPYSERWMSVLDNSRSKEELRITYTPLETYLRTLVQHLEENKPPVPVGYQRRAAERQFAESITTRS